MFATITRFARAGTLSAVDTPHNLAWRTLGAAWTVWLCGWVLGMSAWYWGALLVVSALWGTTAAVDRLRSFGAMSATSAALTRTFLLGMALIWAPRAIVDPTAHLNAWTAVVVTAAAAHVLAPWALENAGRHELWRWWNDVKAAGAAGGGLIVGVVVGGTLASGLGFEMTHDAFIGTLAGSAFCVMPTVLSLRAERCWLRSSANAPT